MPMRSGPVTVSTKFFCMEQFSLFQTTVLKRARPSRHLDHTIVIGRDARFNHAQSERCRVPHLFPDGSRGGEANDALAARERVPIFDVRNFVPVYQLQNTLQATGGRIDVLHNAAFSPDGKPVAATANDGDIRLWENDRLFASGSSMLAAPPGSCCRRDGVLPKPFRSQDAEDDKSRQRDSLCDRKRKLGASGCQRVQSGYLEE